jgi:hypothetical protein
VDVDVILEMSASEGEDRLKKKVRGKAAKIIPSNLELEIVEDLEPRRKNLKEKVMICDAITDKKIIGISDQNLHVNKAGKTRSSDAPQKVK